MIAKTYSIKLKFSALDVSVLSDLSCCVLYIHNHALTSIETCPSSVIQL
jgi:hypothetical protein